MTIDVRARNGLAEVIVTDAYDNDTVSSSGPLDTNERLALADQLRRAAEELEAVE